MSGPNHLTNVRKMVTRHSGLQKEVLALYRKILRVALEKDRTLVLGNDRTKQFFTTTLQSETSTTCYACREFRRQASQAKRSDFKRIEYMIRKGEKQLKLLNMPGVQTIGGSSTKVNADP